MPVIVWAPAVGEGVLMDALPLTSGTRLPLLTPSTWNWTLPPGTPVVELTVAVNVTAWPKVEGVGEDVSVVAVSALFTVWATLPVLALKFGSEESRAGKEWGARGAPDH